MSDRWLTAGTVLRWHFDTKSAHEIVAVFSSCSDRRGFVQKCNIAAPTLPPPVFVPVSVRGVFLLFLVRCAPTPPTPHDDLSMLPVRGSTCNVTSAWEHL